MKTRIIPKNIFSIRMLVLFPAIFLIFSIFSLNNASAFTREYPSGSGRFCSFSPNPETVCSPATNGTGLGYCTNIINASTCNPPGPVGDTYFVCLNGTKDCSAPPTCTSFTYSAWSACLYGTQTRTVLSKSPTGCTGGTPITSQSCYVEHDHKVCVTVSTLPVVWTYVYWYDSNNVKNDPSANCSFNACDTTGDVFLYCNLGNVWGKYDFRIAGCTSGACTLSWNENSCGNRMIKDCSISLSYCGYGTCAGKEKPIKACVSNACSYTCSYSSDCESPAPTANIDLPVGDQVVKADDVVNFSGNGTDTDGTIVAYEWLLGSCGEDGTLLKRSVSGEADFDAIKSSFAFSSVSLDIYDIYFRVLDSSGVWSTNCPTRKVSVNGTYLCVGSAPDEVVQFMCLGDIDNLPKSMDWSSVGPLSSFCTDEKCEYYTPVSYDPPVCMPPMACGHDDGGEKHESYCFDGTNSVPELECIADGGTCDGKDVFCPYPSVAETLRWREVAP